MPMPKLGGVPLVISQVLASGTFLGGAFGQGCALWDRMDAMILVSREHADYFAKHLSVVLGEERVGLTSQVRL
jgi:HK97 family phage major capsid protein